MESLGFGCIDWTGKRSTCKDADGVRGRMDNGFFTFVDVITDPFFHSGQISLLQIQNPLKGVKI